MPTGPGAVAETLEILRTLREKTDAVLVSYSGGKDSVAVIDLAVKTFKRVEAFYLYFLPDLDCARPITDYAVKRWGITVLPLPGPDTIANLRRGVFCLDTESMSSLPKYDLHDAYQAARGHFKLQHILTGCKRGDSMARRHQLSRHWHKLGTSDVWHPIADWSKQDVIAYCARHKLESPGSFVTAKVGRKSTGLGLSVAALRWLYENYPQDFRTVAKVFTFAPAVVWQQRFYNEDGTPREKVDRTAL